MHRSVFRTDRLTCMYPQAPFPLGPWSLQLEAGRTGALCGPSGSGKTTLLNRLAGLYPGGRCGPRISGSWEVEASTDLLLDKPFLQFLGPAVKDEVEAAEAASQLPGEERTRERDWLVEAFLLDALWDRPLRELSEGERQRVALACLFLRSRGLLLLDQPASCLDPRGRAALRAAIQRANTRGTTVLVADPDWQDFAPPGTKPFSLGTEGPLPSSADLQDELADRVARPRRETKEVLLEFEDLEARRKGRTVLRDVSGRVCSGELVMVTGDNGSGKSSLLLTLAGLLRPGRGHLYGPGRGKPGRKGHRPGVMLQEALWHLSGRPLEHELFWAWRRRLPGPAGPTPDLLIHLLGLEHLRNRPVLVLSRGEMQRVALAMTLLRNARLVFLDEPFRFLWPQERERIAGALNAAMSTGTSFIIAAPEGDSSFPAADQVWSLTRGRIETWERTSIFDRSATPSSSVRSGAPSR